MHALTALSDDGEWGWDVVDFDASGADSISLSSLIFITPCVKGTFFCQSAVL